MFNTAKSRQTWTHYEGLENFVNNASIMFMEIY